MTNLPGKPTSPWLDRSPGTSWPRLEEDLVCEVAVIGGGIAGISAAYRLSGTGASVALIEARSIGAGVTGHTSAKLSALQGTVYSHLSSRVSPEAAKQHADLNIAGVAQAEQIAEALGISCDYLERPAITFTEDPGRVSQLEDEVAAA
ncbi:MAG: FAD-binding oxidoreductase, partial [Actinomycetota bacterium]|nr:FAD-binding oxidoreductase [Actinomycetota bacterium]